MMDLGIWADGAALSTAGIALFWSGYYAVGRYRKRRALEDYLKKDRASGKDNGQRTILHLMAKLAMTEGEILRAAFHSKHVARPLAANVKTRRAEAMLLEYVETINPN